MAKFVAAKRVERIEWDFTGVPHIGAQDDDRVSATVQGEHVTGTLPEPSPDTAARFADAHEALIADALKSRQATVDRFMSVQHEDPDADQIAADVLSTKDAYLAQYEQAVAALRILDVPAELIEQLPPRYVAAFLTYVAGELQGEGDAA